ncbi:MAG: glycosyltransferase [Dehalococcoidia bacterium]|nr:MAG: glycosyltransferase [Dehalococcoidia bacterium]
MIDRRPVFVVDPGFLPTTRQMAIAVADEVAAYFTPFAARRDSALAAAPVIGREVQRRTLPDELATRARPVVRDIEAARLLLSRAGMQGFNDQLLWRRNVDADAAAAGQLRAGATVIGQYGGCLESFKRAGVLAGRTVLDYPIARVEVGQEILREEARLRPDFADSMHRGEVPERYLARMAQEVQLADAVVVGSSFAARSFDGVVRRERVHVVPYGVDTSAFRPVDIRRAAGRVRVLFAGTLTQRKGIAYLLEAMGQLDPARFEVTLAGPVLGRGAGLRWYEGSFRHLTGVRPQDMPAVYRAADVLVLPSLLEGSALVVLEAMASGLPVIVTENAGADAVRDGIEGFIVPVRSPEAIAARLEELASPDLRRRMGEAGRARALAFTWEAFHREFRRAAGFDDTEEEREELAA